MTLTKYLVTNYAQHCSWLFVCACSIKRNTFSMLSKYFWGHLRPIEHSEAIMGSTSEQSQTSNTIARVNYLCWVSLSLGYPTYLTSIILSVWKDIMHIKHPDINCILYTYYPTSDGTYDTNTGQRVKGIRDAAAPISADDAAAAATRDAVGITNSASAHAPSAPFTV